MSKAEPLNNRSSPPEHERCLAFADAAVECDRPWLASDERDAARALHGAIGIAAGSDLDRSIGITDRRYGICKPVEALSCLSHHERPRRLCNHRSGRG